MTFLQKLCLIFLIFLCLTSGLFVFLLGTNIGTSLIFKGIKYFIPELTYHSVSGYWGNFNFVDIEYHSNFGIIAIDRCKISLSFQKILKNEIFFHQILCNNIYIKKNIVNEIFMKKNEVRKNNFNNIIYSIVLKNIFIKNIYFFSDQIVLNIKKIKITGMILKNNFLHVLPAYISEISLDCTSDDMFNIKNRSISYILRYSICQFLNKIAGITSSANNIVIKLPYFKENLNIICDRIQGQRLYLIYKNNQYTINNFFLTASLYKYILKFNVDMKFLFGCCNVVGNVILRENWPVNILCDYLNNKNKNLKKSNIKVIGELFNEISLIFNILDSESDLKIILKANLTQNDMSFNLSVIGDKILVSMMGRDSFWLDKLDLCLYGTINNYYIKIKSQLKTVIFAPIYIVLNAHGNLNECSISQFYIDTIDHGSCEIKGLINWTDTIYWNSELVLNNAIFFQKWFESPMNLSGCIKAKGWFCLEDKSWDIIVSNLNLNGYCNKNRILCVGSLEKNKFSGFWSLPIFKLTWGSNTIIIKGLINEQYHCDVILNIPDLNSIFPGLYGSVYGKMKLHGLVQLPILSCSINLFGISYKKKSIFVNDINLNGNFYYDYKIQSSIFLEATQVNIENLLLPKLIIKGSGNLKEHFLQFVSDKNIFFSKFQLCGSWDNDNCIWTGKINKTKFVTSIGSWQLMQDIFLTYQQSTKKIFISSHCWKITNIDFSLPNFFRVYILEKINVILYNYNIVPVKIFPTDVVKVDNVIVHFLDLCWDIDNFLPQGKILFLGKKFNIQPISNTAQIFPLKEINIDIQTMLENDMIRCIWSVDCFDNNSKINGIFKVNFFNDSDPDIIGYLYCKNFSIKPFLDYFFQASRIIDMMLNLKIYFQGKVDSPRLYGSAQLIDHNISCQLNRTFFINNSNLKIYFFGERVLLDGTVELDNKEKLFLNGDVIFFNDFEKIRAFFSVQGNQVGLYFSPNIKMRISPNVTCIINSKKIFITGNIDIPWACIEIHKWSKNAVEISSEEIVVDNDKHIILNKIKKDVSWCIKSNLSIILGNNVNFYGLGLCSKLKGKIEVGYNNEDVTYTGYIDIMSGYFKIYGQNLIIKKGKLLFSGSIRQPYIDIEAIRNLSSNVVDSMMVGIRITGMFSQPKLEVFSNVPLFSRQEIIHYLLGGNDLIFPDSNTNILASILIGTSVGHSDKFIHKIGKVLGVQDLKLNTQSTITAPLVTLSGYIAPGLQIRYGVNIFDWFTTMTLRYSLYPQLYLEAATSKHNQSFDVLYKFNF